MRNTSLIVLAVAIVLGFLSVVGVQGLMRSRGGEQAAKVAMTTVVIARKPLEFGNELTPDALEAKPWPAEAVPEGSFKTIEEVVGADRRVALRSIAPGEPVLKDKVSGFGGRAALSQVIEKGHRAVAVRISDVSGAGGFILPGDRVDVLLTISPTAERDDTQTAILLENVRVLAIDQESDESTGGAIVAKAATIEVAPDNAQRIALASSIGTLSLSLRNTTGEVEETDDKPSRPMMMKDLGVVEEKQEVRARTRAAPAKASPYATINVTRGVEATRASVPREGSGARASAGNYRGVSAGVSNAAGSVAATTAAVTPGN